MSQQSYWNKWNEEHKLTEKPSESAKEFRKLVPRGAKILELGCGPGVDAEYLAKDHQVVATDFAKSAITQNKEKFKHFKTLEFIQHDTAKPLPFADAQFSGVYARLTLHYFDDPTTRAIFTEINRVLKPNGVLYFVCKSTFDSFFGKGRKIDEDTFMDDEDHLRHFFSVDFARKNLAGLFSEEKLEVKYMQIYGSESKVVLCIARKV